VDLSTARSGTASAAALEVIATSAADVKTAAEGGADHQSATMTRITHWRYQGGQWI
jgi:hypothetical protein